MSDIRYLFKHAPASPPMADEPMAEDKRAAELARLLPLWPREIADTSREGRVRLVAKLHRALKAERRRGLAGHWTYDLARHAALLAAWRRERALLGLRDARPATDAQKQGRRPFGRRPRNS